MKLCRLSLSLFSQHSANNTMELEIVESDKTNTSSIVKIIVTPNLDKPPIICNFQTTNMSAHMNQLSHI